MRSSRLVPIVAVMIGVLVGGAADAGAKSGGPVPSVTIRTTEYGVPHIIADGFYGLGYGYGWSLAKQNICPMAQIYTTTRGERSKYFGPDETWNFTGNARVYKNIDSDLFFKMIAARGVVRKLLAQKYPAGPKPEVRQDIRGYAAGYNAYLRRVGVDKIHDPSCRGAAWVRPITTADVYMRLYMLGIMASQGAAIDGIVSASPPGTPANLLDQSESIPDPDAADFRAIEEGRAAIGSNAVALGRQATSTGKGMLLGNPHFPWTGTERLFESQLTIPGKVNASGASLLGTPAINIGHTRNLAWSFTYSTAYRFVPYQENLVPGDPTSYYVDGQPRKMDSTTVKVQVKEPDGTLSTRSHTFYSTVHGFVTTSVLGQNVFPWTSAHAYTMADVNAENFRFLNHFYDSNRLQNVRQLLRVMRRDQGLPWVHTTAADSKGNVLYADMSVVPNVPDSKVTECNTPGIGDIAYQTLGLPVLDGSRSSCDLQKAPGAVAKGILPPSQLPYLIRRDYATNSNDSHWLANPKQPLAGFARILGTEKTPRSLRTRMGLMMVQQRLAGTDGRKGRKFTLAQLQATVMNDRTLSGEMFRGPLAAYCAAHPVIAGVDVSAACPVLANWNGRETLDAPLLFSRIGAHLPLTAASTYTTPFDVDNAVYTPSGVDIDNPAVTGALATAVTELNQAGIPLDATLRQYQVAPKKDLHIPIHGGSGDPEGTFNAMIAPWNGKGLDPIRHGSSFVMAASMTGAKCPPVRTVLSYSQAAENPWSKHYADQTRLFSRKKWKIDRFCNRQQLNSPRLQVERFHGGSKLLKRRGF
ncbi:MAG: penicillin acylase family protein [Solirubrobacterales bacterium]|nr:penicillin acylase family protein [Solirubrobacterales bacterium]